MAKEEKDERSCDICGYPIEHDNGRMEDLVLFEGKWSWSFVKTEQLLENIKSGKYELLEEEVSENDYGEWIFVWVREVETKSTIGFYSNFGFHYKKERYLLSNSFTKYTTNEWNNYNGKPLATIEELEATITKYWNEIKAKYEKQEPENKFQRERNTMYDLLTYLGDEDGTISEMEDLGLL